MSLENADNNLPPKTHAATQQQQQHLNNITYAHTTTKTEHPAAIRSNAAHRGAARTERWRCRRHGTTARRSVDGLAVQEGAHLSAGPVLATGTENLTTKPKKKITQTYLD